MDVKKSEFSCPDDSNSSTFIVLTLMQQDLPQHIQNMFMAAGYETLQTIAEMDVNLKSKPNDSDKILDYVKQNLLKDPRYIYIDANFIVSINTLVAISLGFFVLIMLVRDALSLLDIGMQ